MVLAVVPDGQETTITVHTLAHVTHIPTLPIGPVIMRTIRKYIEAQLDAFEVAAGWFFWNWKCEDASNGTLSG